MTKPLLDAIFKLLKDFLTSIKMLSLKKPIPVLDPSVFGTFLTTPGVAETFDQATVIQCLKRHLQNDWGDIHQQDKKVNVYSVKKLNGGTVMSVYKVKPDQTLWIITVGLGNDPSNINNCNTVALLPTEY